MRYAIVSDIHANWQAWSAVRDDIRRRSVDTMVCLGDIVGYGPSPTRVFGDLLAHCDNFVLGNHDAAAAGGLDRAMFNENARRSAEWTAAQFDAEALKRLGGAPLVLEDEDILFVHAETPAPDEFGYVETEEDARACFDATDARFIFIGHTHRPQIFALRPDGTISVTTEPHMSAKPGTRYLVNVGSVGDPGDGTVLASYCVFDASAGEIALRQVAFDVAAFRAELERVPELSLPWFLQQHEGETARPVYDQAVAAGKVARTKIRVTSSRARVRVKASALATRTGDGRRGATLPTKAPKANRSTTGLLIAAICVMTIGALAAIHFLGNRRAPVQVAATGAPAAAPSLQSAAVAPGAELPILPAFAAIASREERAPGVTNVALMAVDASPATRWCSGDGLAGNWLQIDLGRELRLGGMNIAWEIPDLAYGYRIEGSSDTRRWTVLAEGNGRSVDRIALTAHCAHVRITVTSLPATKWASIADVTFFDEGGRAIRAAPPVIETASPTPVAQVPDAVAATGGTVAEPYNSLDALGRIAEAKDYRLVYDLDLAKLSAKVGYEVDQAAAAPRFDRVAYLIELKKAKEPARFLWVSMDAFTTDAAKLGVPTAASGVTFQQKVANLTVLTDVAGIATGERIGAGQIEFWSSNYGQKNSANVPGASNTDYDFGDSPGGPPDGYGCMQVHNIAAKQTLFAVNSWRKGAAAADLGIGNSSGSARGARCLDWTFSGNGGTYSAKRLRVFVRPAP